MIVYHKHFEFKGKALIEKLAIRSPLKQSPVFQDEACFIYFKEGEGIIISPTENTIIKNGESVLLKCGSYFAEIINKIENEICEVYVIHLYPELLKDIYRNEIPDFFQSKEYNYYTKKNN